MNRLTHRQPVAVGNRQSPYLTARETAGYLRKSMGAIHMMVYRKQLIAYKPAGRLLFKKEHLDEVVARSEVKIGYGD